VRELRRDQRLQLARTRFTRFGGRRLSSFSLGRLVSAAFFVGTARRRYTKINEPARTALGDGDRGYRSLGTIAFVALGVFLQIRSINR